MSISDGAVQLQDQFIGHLIFFGGIGGIALLAYGFGRCTRCPSANTFENVRFKGRFSLMWMPFFLATVVLFLIGLVMFDIETMNIGSVGIASVVVFQIIWACAEVGILHNQVMRYGQTLGMAGVYSHERKRWWVKCFQPGRWIMLRLMLPGAYKMARRIRKEV